MFLDLFKTSPDAAYIYLERYVNDGSPSGHSGRSTSAFTAPTSDTEEIELIEVLLNQDISCRDFGDNSFYNFPEQTLLVHPDMLEEEIIINNICGVKSIRNSYPTATGRTVKVAGQDLFVKLTYNKLIGRMDRQISMDHVVAGLEVSEEIVEMLTSSNASPRSAVFKEVFGRVAFLPVKRGFYEWGYVLREYKPYPYTMKSEYLIPCFALFSSDMHSPSDLPLLIQLFRSQKKDPISFILEDIIFPIYDTYFGILTKCGIGLEAHAQNILVTIDENFQVSRIVVRDLESAYRDIPLRLFLNTNKETNPTGYKCINSDDYNYTEVHSFMFDFKLGEYLITPLLACMNNYYQIDIQSVSNQIKLYNRNYLDILPHEYFPKCWYNYANEIFKPGENRRYIAHKSPKYR